MYNYPGLITLGTGTKYDFGAYYSTEYSESNGNLSEIALKPYVGAF